MKNAWPCCPVLWCYCDSALGGWRSPCQARYESAGWLGSGLGGINRQVLRATRTADSFSQEAPGDLFIPGLGMQRRR